MPYLDRVALEKLPVRICVPLNFVFFKTETYNRIKSDSSAVAELYDKAGFGRHSERMCECGNYLGFTFAPDFRDLEKEILKLTGAKFCRVRLCPMCQERKSAKWRGKFLKAVPLMLLENPGWRFIALTLTIKNCHISELRETIKLLNKAWKKLTSRKSFPTIGYLKTIEVTRQAGTDYAHPHIHAVLVVLPSYFSGNYYLKKEEWVDIWQECLEVDYKPSVYVKAVRPKNNEGYTDALERAVVETLKYGVKPADLVVDEEWLRQLTVQIKGTKGISTSGVIRSYLGDEPPPNKQIVDIWANWEDRENSYMLYRNKLGIDNNL